jgi:UDP-2-acetamido-3-amino-2,3-dideoxy-glucuronate N-acetyltransferase
VCGITIGEFAFVGAGTVVNKDVKPFALMVGVPAKQIAWMSAYGEKLDLPLNGEQIQICPHTTDIYSLSGSKLTRQVHSDIK